jgi:ABC-2 type transport system ATP-binding protein
VAPGRHATISVSRDGASPDPPVASAVRDVVCISITSAVSSPVISVSRLGKRYGPVVAVDDVSLEVRRGEIFGLIGPNGAGKTTTMECVEGLRTADRGTISVLGLDPRRDATALRRRIGVQHQEAHLQKRIKVWEAVDLWSTLYARVVDTEALLARLGLDGKRDAWFMSLSGGQKQRLFVALALIHDPELVFLDELTTGLDPQARRAIWDLVLGMKERGKTVFLTTHLMEEAERLCDRVAIIEHGRVLEMGTPAELVARHCPERRVVFTTDADGVARQLADVPGFRSASADGATHTLEGEGDDFVTDAIYIIARERIHVRGFRTETPTLEDVFLKLTGHGIRD